MTLRQHFTMRNRFTHFFNYHTLLKFNALTTVADRIIIGLALALLVWLYSHYWIAPSLFADYALIWVANQPPKRFNLEKTQQISVQGHLGESLIEIKEGKIRFVSSPCQMKYCIHSGWLTHNGEVVACLPNQITIQLQTTEKQQFDSIAY
jgi:hypothetical protein